LLPEVAGPISRASGEMLARRVLSELTGLFGVRLLSLGHDLSLHSARSAARLRLRGADAVYVALAASFGMPLVTWDGEQQERAARAIDVRTPSELLAGAP